MTDSAELDEIRQKVDEMHVALIGTTAQPGIAFTYPEFVREVRAAIDALREGQTKHRLMLAGNGGPESGVVYRLRRVEEQVALLVGIKNSFDRKLWPLLIGMAATLALAAWAAVNDNLG